MKTFAAFLFAFLLLWPGFAPAAATEPSACDGDVVLSCAGCSCCASARPVQSSSPAAPAPSRPAAGESLVLLLPTTTAELLELDRSSVFSFASARNDLFVSAGAVPLFRRDCAWLI